MSFNLELWDNTNCMFSQNEKIGHINLQVIKKLTSLSPDAISSATSQYFADKGLMWTYIDGARVDSTFLHLREWLSGIRNGTELSCGIKECFEEAITAHMTGLSWKLGRRIDWDRETETIKPIDDIDFDAVLLGNTIY